jgi:hypothetical protein
MASITACGYKHLHLFTDTSDDDFSHSEDESTVLDSVLSGNEEEQDAMTVNESCGSPFPVVPIGTRVVKQFRNPETWLMQDYEGKVVSYDEDTGWYGVSAANIIYICVTF